MSAAEEQERPARRPMVGIGFKLSSVVAFVCMGSCIKLAGMLPAGQIVFFRSAFAVIPILLFLTWRGQLATALKTSRPGSHVVRALVGVSSMFLGFFALTRLPLPEATTLGYATPLLVVVFSAVFLGEAVRVFRWTAVVIGFVGVAVIAWPKLTLFTGGAGMDDSEFVGVTAALVAAGISAVATLLIRRLVLTEPSATIVMWFSLSAALIALATWPFGWARLDAWQVTFLVLAGLCGGVGQILMTESYRHADVSTIAPFEYSSMILAIVAGYLLFGDAPSWNMLVGGAIVVGAGIFIIWREHALGLPRGAARKVMPPQ